MKKLPLSRRYLTISFYAFLVVIVSALCILAVTNYTTVLNIIKNLLSILTPFIWGGCLAYILNPVLKTCERILNAIFKDRLSRRARRTIGMLLTYIFAIALLAVLLQIILPQIIDSIKNLIPQITAWINTLPVILNDLATRYQLDINQLTQTQTITMIWNNIQTTITGFISDLTTLIPQLFQLTTSLVGSLLNVLIGIILSVYLLASKELFYAHAKKLGYALFPKRVMDKLLEITHTSNNIFTGFIVGKIVDSTIIGVLCFIVMALFNWPYAMLISVIVGVTNVIPYFGPFIGAIPSILLLLIIDPRTAVMFGSFILILQQLDGNIIGPKILGDSTGLSAFWVVFSITLFSAIMGPIGMLIGVPTFAVIYSLIRDFAEWRLKTKNMATATDDYASPEHAIIHKDASPPHPGDHHPTENSAD